MTAITKRTMLRTLSMIRDSIDLSNTLDKLLAVISLEFLKDFHRMDWDFIFFGISFFLCKFASTNI